MRTNKLQLFTQQNLVHEKLPLSTLEKMRGEVLLAKGGSEWLSLALEADFQPEMKKNNSCSNNLASPRLGKLEEV